MLLPIDTPDHGFDLCRSDSSDEELSISSDMLESSLGTFAMHHDEHNGDMKAESHAENAKESSHHLEGSPLEAWSMKTGCWKIPKYVDCYRPTETLAQMSFKSFGLATPHNQELSVISGIANTAANVDRLIFEHMRPYFRRSNMSQEALQEWDKQQGLPPSHARTTLNSGRTRRMLVEFLSNESII
jgi:hypothetical protein